MSELPGLRTDKVADLKDRSRLSVPEVVLWPPEVSRQSINKFRELVLLQTSLRLRGGKFIHES